MIERAKDWIRRRLLRATETPYQCYWRDRAFRAEAELRRLGILPPSAFRLPPFPA